MTSSRRIFVLLEILFFVCFSVASKSIVLLWTFKYAGPITLILPLFILTLYMRRQGKTWAQYGLKPLMGIKQKLLVIPQTALVFIAFAIAVGSLLEIANVFQISALLQVS